MSDESLEHAAQRAARPNIAEALESLIDSSSLLDVLTGLELVCREKAEHIRVNWQDRATARPWDRAAKRIYAVALQTEI